MNKFILTFLLLIFTNICNAQWYSHKFPKDEMFDRESYVGYFYNDSNGNTFRYYTCSSNFHIDLKHGIYDYQYDNKYITAVIGYYKNGKFIKKEVVTLFVEKPDSACSSSKTDVEHRIIPWLESGGDIRIVCDRYNKTDLDFYIKCRKY